MTPFKQCVVVSPEMLSFIGPGELSDVPWPPDPVMLQFAGLGDDASPLVAVVRNPQPSNADRQAALVFVVREEAASRLSGDVPADGVWHLPSGLRTLAVAIRDCAAAGAMGETLRLARSIELLCGFLELLSQGALVPVDGDGTMSEPDARRIAAARRMVDERWHEKLTLDGIARACGLNRSKLSRGFRAAYHCTVVDALTERRLTGACRMLEATDLPVSAIGYRCGYLNNASFTRAFARRLGVAPTRWRVARGAAA